MKYMGGKGKLAKHILPIVLRGRTDSQWYVEPFMGGANMIDKVPGNRIGADINPYLMAMWVGLVDGTLKPEKVERELYASMRENPEQYSHGAVGWVGFNCSYSGKWFGGFAGETKTKLGTVRDYQQEALNNVDKQISKLGGVVMQCQPYYELEIPERSVIYCDPPYANTTGYKDAFDHARFWDWCRGKSKEGHSVFVSEYQAPDDFDFIWAHDVKSSLSANGKCGGSKISTERLFTQK